MEGQRPRSHLIPETLGRSVNWKTMGPNQCRITEVFENMIKIFFWKFYWDYRTSLSPNPCQDSSQEFLLLIPELRGLFLECMLCESRVCLQEPGQFLIPVGTQKGFDGYQ